MNRLTALVLPLLVLGLAGPALAQGKKKAAKKPPAEIIVVNARAATLVEFSLTTEQGKNVAALKAVLAPGKRATLKLARGAACQLTVSAAYDDESENAGGVVDVCADKTIRFTD